jgi:flagellin-like protein
VFQVIPQMNSQKGEMGVGTLIIFIAMLLVAAVAAGVLLQTAGSLQQKALNTGQQSKSEISTNARVIEVSAVDASADSTVENFSMQMKLSPGSDPIKLGEVTLTFNTDNTSTTLSYLEPFSATIYCQLGGGATNYTRAELQNCAQSDLGTGTGNFTVEYLINGTNNIEGNLQRGDVIRVYWAAPRTITEDEHVRINFIPKIGAATLVEFNTPDVMSTQRVYLYP